MNPQPDGPQRSTRPGSIGDTQQSASTPSPARQPRFERIGSNLRLRAAERLIEAGGRRGTSAAREFLRAATQHGISLTHFWAAVRSSPTSIGQVCLGVPGAGRTCTVFTSTPSNEPDRDELAGVIRAMCDGLSGVRLAQALLEQGQDDVQQAFFDAGFTHLATLAYLRAPIPPATPTPQFPPLHDSIRVESYRPEREPDLRAALTHSYIDTLDCPALCGMRDLTDVIDSHRSTGTFDPDLWWIVYSDDQPKGVVLMNVCPAQGSTELVYLGLAPALRGRALAEPLMRRAMQRLAEQGQTTLTCAVDERNAPAQRLYDKLGFEPFGRRIAMVMPLDG